MVSELIFDLRRARQAAGREANWGAGRKHLSGIGFGVFGRWRVDGVIASHRPTRGCAQIPVRLLSFCTLPCQLVGGQQFCFGKKPFQESRELFPDSEAIKSQTCQSSRPSMPESLW